MEAALNKLFRRRKSKKSPITKPEPVPIPKIQSNYIETILDHYNQVSTVISGVPIAKRAEQEYRLTPSHWIFLGTSATMVLILSHPAQFVAEILGFLLPVSQSLRALETETVQDDIQWLTYWVVFACINMIEPLLSWIPRYYTAKAILILWLLMPQTRGAEVIYKKVIRPRMTSKLIQEIDKDLEVLGTETTKTVESVHRISF